MEINDRIPYVDVIVTTKDICEFLTGEDHTILTVPVDLQEENGLKQYVSVVVCKVDDEAAARNDILKKDGLSRDEYKVDEKYCHITTYKAEDINKREISFNQEDDYPIKACFSPEYENIEQFFKNFIKMRNNLIREKQLVKEDDIDQYFQALTGFARNKDTKFNKIKQKFIGK